MNNITCLALFIILLSIASSACQRHTHAHHHDAPGSYRQSVNQQMHLPFHIEQKYEHSATNSNDVELNLQSPNPMRTTPTFPQKQAKQNVKK